MRLGLAVAGLACAATSSLAQEPAAAPAFVEWALERDQVWRGETLRARVRFGLERGFMEQGLVQPFRRRLDVPVRLLLPGLMADPCLGAAPVARAQGAEFALDQDVARALELEARDVDGAAYRVFEFELELRPTCVGESLLPAPRLVVTTALDFRLDAFGNRTPVEPVEVVRAGAAAPLRVLALPEAGRPADFSGAVGTFTLTAAAREPVVELGQGMLFELVLEGVGDLAAIEPPRLEGLAGLRERGRLEHLEPGRRTWTYELVPLDLAVREVPGIELSIFDTAQGAWRRIASAPVPIEVRAPPPRVVETPAEPVARPARLWWLAPVSFLLLGWWWRRSRPREQTSAARERALAAQAEFASSAGDALARYTAFLARFLDCPPPAVVGARLAERLVEAGAPVELAGRLARHHDELTAVRYGGRAAGPDGEADALARELVASLG
jgi:hypothetical protein